MQPNNPNQPFSSGPPQPPYGGQQPYGGGPIPGAEKKMPAAICGILLGGFGVHKFILGYTTEGLIMIAATVFTCGLAWVVGLIEGIIYLTKSDEQFVQEYIVNKKPWF